MEIVQINKYESINDRIKRLAAKGSEAVQPNYNPSVGLNQGLSRNYQGSTHALHARNDSLGGLKGGYGRKRMVERVSTQENEHTFN